MNALKKDIKEFSDYPTLLEQVKEKIKSAQLKAALSVNSELVLLYWEIGKMLSVKMAQKGWGAKVIDRLAQDLVSSCKNPLQYLSIFS